MPNEPTLDRLTKLASQFSGEPFIRFGFPIEKPTSFKYELGTSDGCSQAEILRMEASGVVFSPDEFRGCFCDFNINCPYKTNDIKKGYVGFGVYEAALNRFSFWVKVSSLSFNNLIAKWNLERSLGSDVAEAFGENFWSSISCTAVNFKKGNSVLSDGDAVLFDLKEITL